MPEFDVKPGVAIPPPGRPPKYPFKTMAVDEMFFVPDKTTEIMSTYAALQGRKLDKKFTTQMAFMRQPTKGGAWEPCRDTSPGAVHGVVVRRIS